jgi:predicted sugar kinase
MLGLSVAQALAWVNGLPLENTTALAQAVGLEPQHALEVWGFDRGGLLLVDTPPSETRREGDQGTRSSCPMNLSPSPPLLRSLSQRGGVVRRQEIAHPDKEAWAFVFFFPRVPPSLESDRLRVPSGCLLAAAPHLSSESGRLVTEKLWPAVENDDIAAFGQSLMALQQMNREALAAAGTPHQLNDEGLSRAAPREAPGPIPRLPLGRGARDQAILALMRDHGAFAWGQSLTGLGLFGLVKGAAASVELRTKLRHQVGFFAGRIMATITDNSGARHVVKDENLR